MVLLLFVETAWAKVSLRVSSLRFNDLEAGREGTKGCLALICLEGVDDSCG
jgi:hypothetical protein